MFFKVGCELSKLKLSTSISNDANTVTKDGTRMMPTSLG